MNSSGSVDLISWRCSSWGIDSSSLCFSWFTAAVFPCQLSDWWECHCVADKLAFEWLVTRNCGKWASLNSSVFTTKCLCFEWPVFEIPAYFTRKMVEFSSRLGSVKSFRLGRSWSMLEGWNEYQGLLYWGHCIGRLWWRKTWLKRQSSLIYWLHQYHYWCRFWPPRSVQKTHGSAEEGRSSDRDGEGGLV